jgi:HPt (histidine-containing phosphotransfer) domain-containing protein
MDLINDLQGLGVNTDEALKRFMNNASLYERMLGKLPKNVRELEVMPCLTTQDYDKALQNAHTLKGVMGNLSVTPLYNGYSEIVTLLRANDPEKATDTLKSILPIQDTIISRIENNS